MSGHRLAPWLLAPCLAFFAVLAIPWRASSAPARAPEAPPAAAGAPSAPTATDHAPAAPTAAAAVAVAIAPQASDRQAPEDAPPPRPAAEADAAPPPERPATVAQRGAAAQPLLGAMTYDAQRGRYVAPHGAGQAVLTISPRLQQGLEKLLASFHVPQGAVVLLDPRTGRVLAMAEHAERGAPAHLALQPIAPAASVFKIVTSAALLGRGIGPDSEVCFHGGSHRIQPALLRDDPRRDRRCLTLSSALGKSANVVFAKLARRALSPEQLRSEANRLLFNAAIPFDWPVEPSPALISDDRFDFATTAAGFGPVRLSPLHGAVLAGLVANRGTFVPPRVIEEVDGAAAPAGASRQLLRPEVAAALARMMETTTTEGTARKVFRGDRRRSALREVVVAGKTGSLADAAPFRDYSWFVGFAPADAPQVAVAAVVVNERLWRVKAPFVAREALRAYFEEAPSPRLRTASR
jgi:penicillin-binding protein A